MDKKYPYSEGDFLILGPDIFTYLKNDDVICYKGMNYLRQGPADE